MLKGIGAEPELNFKSGRSEGILGDNGFIDEVLEKVKITQKQNIQLMLSRNIPKPYLK